MPMRSQWLAGIEWMKALLASVGPADWLRGRLLYSLSLCTFYRILESVVLVNDNWNVSVSRGRRSSADSRQEERSELR